MGVGKYQHRRQDKIYIDKEFLKQYKYVKEYGEGIDRIYRELEQAGLPEITINNDVFVLTVTAYNRSAGKTEVKTEKPEVNVGKPEAETGFRGITAQLRKKKAQERTIQNVQKLFEVTGYEPFTSGDIVRILNRSQSAASEMVNNFSVKYGIIEPIENERNKYRFKRL